MEDSRTGYYSGFRLAGSDAPSSMKMYPVFFRFRQVLLLVTGLATAICYAHVESRSLTRPGRARAQHGQFCGCRMEYRPGNYRLQTAGALRGEAGNREDFRARALRQALV